MKRAHRSGTRRRAAAALMATSVLLGVQTSVALGAEAPATVERVSVGERGVEGDQGGGSSAASADGRFVAFASRSSNLVPGDTGDDWDAFVRDRAKGTTRLVSGSSGRFAGGVSISADGRYVAFTVHEEGRLPEVYAQDLMTGTTERVSVSRDGSPGSGSSPSISADGRYVAFMSMTSLVPKDSNRDYDIYVRDRERRVTRRVSVSSTGRQSDGFSEDPAISADGRYVAFASYASNLVPNDTGTWDVFVRDLQRRTTRKVSVNRHGRRSNSASRDPAISATGRFIAFTSSSSDLVSGDTNDEQEVFVRDMVRGTTERVAVSSTERQVDNDSVGAVISQGGRYVAFSSWAGNLVRGDTNGTWDAFVRDRRNGTTRRVSVSSAGRQGRGVSYASWVSANGRYLGFDSEAANLVPDDRNGSVDSFLWDRGRR